MAVFSFAVFHKLYLIITSYFVHKPYARDDVMITLFEIHYIHYFFSQTKYCSFLKYRIVILNNVLLHDAVLNI